MLLAVPATPLLLGAVLAAAAKLEQWLEEGEQWEPE